VLVAAIVVLVASASGTMNASSLTVSYLDFDQSHTALLTKLLIAAAAAAAAILTAATLAERTPGRARLALIDVAQVGSIAVLGGVLAIASGAMDSCNLTLVFMGFDQDRAQLITSLLISSAAAGAATLAIGKPRLATLFGLCVFGALFGHVFAVESDNAMRSTGVDGSFDLAGWFSTLVTLATVGVISSGAGAALVQAIRPSLVSASVAAVEAVRSRRADRRVVRPLAVVGVLVLLAFTVPIFGDMVNYTPDSRMLRGGAPPVGLIPDGPTESPGASPLGVVPGSATLSSKRPWLSWRPSGSGSVTAAQLPAPWANGATTPDVNVYTPPGYQANGSRHYPVLYEAPTGFAFWDSATNVKIALDTLIDRGVVPPMIVVFVGSGAGPYPDSECADSYDGKEQMDTFISQTVVAYVDSHYLTIARADARAITGFSQGGYCAAILALRHPTVFATSIPFSGYFRAGAADVNSKAPFGGDSTALAAASPMVVAAGLPPSERTGLLFIVVAKSGDPFFGQEATDFVNLLATQGYSYVAIQDKVGHGWNQIRNQFMAALEAWSGHLVSTGAL
jgi:enterochelin esterase-like enzyme